MWAKGSWSYKSSSYSRGGAFWQDLNGWDRSLQRSKLESPSHSYPSSSLYHSWDMALALCLQVCTRGKTTDGVKPFRRSATTCRSSVPLAVSVSSLCQSWGMLLALCLQFCTRGQSMADYISLPAPGAMLSGQRSSRRKGPQNWDSWSAAGQTGL